MRRPRYTGEGLTREQHDVLTADMVRTLTDEPMRRHALNDAGITPSASTSWPDTPLAQRWLSAHGL